VRLLVARAERGARLRSMRRALWRLEAHTRTNDDETSTPVLVYNDDMSTIEKHVPPPGQRGLWRLEAHTRTNDDDMSTPERHVPRPGQRGHNPQRRTAAGTAFPTTTKGNTAPQRAKPTQTAYAHSKRGAPPSVALSPFDQSPAEFLFAAAPSLPGSSPAHAEQLLSPFEQSSADLSFAASAPLPVSPAHADELHFFFEQSPPFSFAVATPLPGSSPAHAEELLTPFEQSPAELSLAGATPLSISSPTHTEELLFAAPPCQSPLRNHEIQGLAAAWRKQRAGGGSHVAESVTVNRAAVNSSGTTWARSSDGASALNGAHGLTRGAATVRQLHSQGEASAVNGSPTMNRAAVNRASTATASATAAAATATTAVAREAVATAAAARKKVAVAAAAVREAAAAEAAMVAAAAAAGIPEGAWLPALIPERGTGAAGIPEGAWLPALIPERGTGAAGAGIPEGAPAQARAQAQKREGWFQPVQRRETYQRVRQQTREPVEVRKRTFR